MSVALEFEITNQILKRTDTNILYNKNYNDYDCVFDFGEDNEWTDVDKYVIFRDGWNNKITIHLGEDDALLSCPVPNKMLNGSFFKIIVLGGELKTNTISMGLTYTELPKPCSITDEDENGVSEYDYEYDNHSIITITDCNKPQHHKECPSATECNKNEIDVFTEIFNRLKTLVDNVQYNDKEILLYNDGNLLETVSLPFLTVDEIQELININLGENLLDNLPIATSSQQGLLSAEDKSKLDGLSNVAMSGDYNDLNNIPVEFNPSHHNHLINDVTDYEDNFNYDLNLILDLLSDEISKN